MVVVYEPKITNGRVANLGSSLAITCDLRLALGDYSQGVDDRSRGYDRRPMLVVVKHWDVQPLLESSLDLETLGCTDVPRLIPPNVGSRAAAMSMNLSGSSSFTLISKTSRCLICALI